MEDLSVPSSLILVWDLKRALEKNQSIQLGIKTFVFRGLRCKFASNFADFWRQYQLGPGQSTEIIFNNINFTSTQRALMFLVTKGLAGQPIYENLKSLEREYIGFCEDQIQLHIQKLPLLLQIPMLGLIFPSMMSLLIIPALGMLRL